MYKSISVMCEVSLVRVASLCLFLYFVSSPLYGVCNYKLRSNATISSSRIILEDVVENTNQHLPNSVCTEHLSIDLGPSPLPGRHSNLSADEVRQILNSELGIGETQLDGIKQIRIYSLSQEMDAQSLISFVQAAYNQYLGSQDSFKVSVLTAAISFNQKIRPGFELAEILEFREKSPINQQSLFKFLNPNQNLRLKISYPDQSSSDLYIPIRVSLDIQQKVAFTNKDVSAHSILQKDDLVLSWIPFQRNSRKYFASMDSLVGKKTKMSVNFENPILQSQIEGAVHIKSGTIVDAMVRRGNMKVYMKLKAMNSGFEGAQIEAMSLRGNQRYKAKVISSNRVEVL